MTLYDKDEAADLSKDEKDQLRRALEAERGCPERKGDAMSKTTSKRNVFAELMEGVGAMQQHRGGQGYSADSQDGCTENGTCAGCGVFCRRTGEVQRLPIRVGRHAAGQSAHGGEVGARWAGQPAGSDIRGIGRAIPRHHRTPANTSPTNPRRAAKGESKVRRTQSAVNAAKQGRTVAR